MQQAPLPDDESARIAALAESGLLDTPTERVFDALTQAAAVICDTPIALVSLIDQRRQWFKSAIGLSQGAQTPRDAAFCAHAILAPRQLMEIPDAARDERFSDNPLVTGAPDIRFYAGAPLLTRDGHALGALCVIDRKPRELNDMQRHALRELAHAVTALIDARRQQADSERQLHRLYHDTPAMLYSLDGSGRLIAASQLWLDRLGYTRDEILGRNPREFMTPASREAFLQVRQGYWSAGGCRDHACQFVRADGSVIDVLMSAVVERAAHGEPVRALCVLTDVTEQLRLQRELQRVAHEDSLTGASNRGRFVELLGAEIERANRHGRALSLVLFDVDRFKQVNDTYGHAAGDAALRSLAAVAKAQLRRSDVLGRLGGEEFALLLPETGGDGALQVAERLREAVAAIPVAHADRSFAVTISLGVSSLLPGDTPDRVLARADEALYAGKRSGRNRTVAWEARTAQSTLERLAFLETSVMAV